MSLLNNARILVTGGTGSFGRAFVDKLLLSNSVEKIVILSRDEKKQYDMRKAYSSDLIDFCIGDIRDANRVSEVMHGVDYVFHAAALKQVPSCEYFPLEAVQTNIIGANNVLTSAMHAKVKKVVVLSTDKAAYPVNAMGCSKMMMEKLTLAKSRILDSPTDFCVVRYGNVLYSRGSVVPLFVNQIQNNKSITITDSNMTRFLMPLAEAIDLVLYTLINGKTGDLLIRKAKASSVVNLAHACKRIYNSNVPIEFIGIRPGEKLHETLATSEELSRSDDLGDYWRINAEHSDQFRSYFSGNSTISQRESFSSNSSEPLSVDDVVSLLLKLPEFSGHVT